MARIWTDRYSPHLVRACNALLAAASLPSLVVDPAPYRAGGFALRPRMPDGIAADLSFGSRGGRMVVDGGAPLRLLEGVPWRLLSNELRRLALEAALQPLLQWLGSVLGERVSVADASGAQLPPAANVLRIRFAPLHAVAGAVPLQAHVALADADWLHVAETVSRAGARRRMGNGTRLPLTLRIVLTGAALARSELARLKPGDMIRVAGDEAPGGKLRRVSLRLGQTDLFACRVQPAGLTIETASSLDARRTSMSNDAALKRLDQLEVPVSFQFGTLPVSLEQLGSIGPGHTFTTSLPTEQPVVSIIVDGQKLGTGRLIAVGELVGVQVIDWVQGD